MPEYINKTKFLEQLRQELSEIDTVHHDHIDIEKQMYEFAVKKVEEMEGEDVEPVKHGKWVRYEGVNTYLYGKYHCSVCGEKAVYDHDNYGYEIDANLTDCCPHCGARMDGGSNNGV